MAMVEGQVYRCQNRNCACEIKVLRASTRAKLNPRCCCGAEMKRPYPKPAMRILTCDMEMLTTSRSGRN
jgi:hypothetical protein